MDSFGGVLTCAILGVVLLATVGAQYQEEDGVLVLTKDTFDQAKTDFNDLMVEFCKSRHLFGTRRPTVPSPTSRQVHTRSAASRVKSLGLILDHSMRSCTEICGHSPD